MLMAIACMIGCAFAAAAARACSCEPSTPEAGSDRAQYVFTGTVVKTVGHQWWLDVERVWKGHDKLDKTVRLMDAYVGIDCETFFKVGERYLVFAILAKGNRHPFYHPQVCNWTRPLHSERVLADDGESLWLEDLIVRNHGPGEPPLSQNP
jgi:hypothetical protein